MFDTTRSNSSLHIARENKNGEFFMIADSIRTEMPNYIKCLKGKKVYIPNTKFTTELSQYDEFARYFATRSMIEKFGIKELSYSYYNEFNQFVLITFSMNCVVKEVMNAVADDARLFPVYKQIDKVDVVIGNPAGDTMNELFSYVMYSQKDYIFCSNINFLTTNVAFSAIHNNYLKFGVSQPTKFFDANAQKVVTFGNKMWITSFDTGNTPDFLKTFYTFDSYDYEKFDNYDAICIKCIKMIPMDYDGIMGVPVSILPLLNLNQFEIIGFRKGTDGKDLSLNGKYTYTRVLVRFRR